MIYCSVTLFSFLKKGGKCSTLPDLDSAWPWLCCMKKGSLETKQPSQGSAKDILKSLVAQDRKMPSMYWVDYLRVKVDGLPEESLFSGVKQWKVPMQWICQKPNLIL